MTLKRFYVALEWFYKINCFHWLGNGFSRGWSGFQRDHNGFLKPKHLHGFKWYQMEIASISFEVVSHFRNESVRNNIGMVSKNTKVGFNMDDKFIIHGFNWNFSPYFPIKSNLTQDLPYSGYSLLDFPFRGTQGSSNLTSSASSSLSIRIKLSDLSSLLMRLNRFILWWLGTENKKKRLTTRTFSRLSLYRVNDDFCSKKGHFCFPFFCLLFPFLFFSSF